MEILTDTGPKSLKCGGWKVGIRRVPGKCRELMRSMPESYTYLIISLFLKVLIFVVADVALLENPSANAKTL